MEDDEQDEMLMVDADFKIIKKLTDKTDLLCNNLDKLINNNNVFIENMLNINTNKDLNNNDNKDKIVDNTENIKNKLYNMKLEELKDICKKNNIKKYTSFNKTKLIDYIISKNINNLIL